jgi:enoyl-CoA hydratase/carnithine racemase
VTSTSKAPDQALRPAVRYQVSNGVATLELDRPAALNAINAQMRTELPQLVAAANADPEVRVLVLRGAGERAFCAGADVTEFIAEESLPQVRATRDREAWNDVIAASGKPTVAAIHGHCLGGGVELALACDIRIAAADAKFGFPEVGLGIIPGAGGTQRLPRLIGLAAALRMILTTERIDASRALAIGLVSEVIPVADFDARVVALSELMASSAPLAVRYAKRAMVEGGALPLAAGLHIERDLATLLTNTEDRLEGARAFKERRSPKFTGH